jgi:hypothetical protein
MTPHPELRRLLNAVRRRWFIAVTLQLSARIFAAAAAVIAAAAVVDHWLHPPDAAVLLLSITALALIAIAGSFLIWPFRHRPDDARVARFVEERCPELEDTIVSAVDVSRRAGGSDTFASLVIDGAVARLRELDLARIFDGESLRGRALGAVVASAALALVLVFAAPLLFRAFEVARLRYLPGTIAVAVQPGDVRVPAGHPLTIAASLSARARTLTRVVPTLTLVSNGQSRSVAMVQAGERYEVRINAVDRSFTYRVHAGAATSREYGVTALFPPRVRRIDLRYEFPSFTGLRPREAQDGGDIYGPAGTRVRVRVHTDKPVQQGHLALSEGKPAVPLVRVEDRTYESTLMLADDAAYRVALADADGLHSEGTEYFIRLMDDRPPDVHVLRPAGDQQITPLEEVTIEARADDDYGIASFEMVYAVAGGRERVVPFTTIGGTDVSRIGSRMVAAEDLGVKPGDVITYYARARDVARGKPSTLTRSEIFFLEVKPFNEEYVAAQSQAMAGAMGTELESLVAAQKEIISATWNLERRSVAGRSAADVKAIADAQAELKVRAQQAAGALRPRRRGFPQQISARQPAPASGGDPVADAVAAMTRAIAQLESRKTGEAIPHEMEALNALLKAQAEVRRRQVMQQQASGANSGGSGRQGQDLSSLFDRELKRQQRTNYETESHIEQQPEGQKTDESALDRIRDLARRQEELGRRQREMADAGLSAEELKRQLEKLTREQEQLRQQAENLARQMAQQSQPSDQQRSGQKQTGQQPSAPQPSGRPQPGQQAQLGGASSLRDAMEQMRDAASQLARQDPASAAARSEQAARRLRDLESQMQAGSPDARRRALGDLQLESQQVAEAQRRIAREADRLDREGGGTIDARRRLAGEKEQLADRVDALEQSARRLGTDPKSASTDRATVNEAARDLESQQLGARMRAGARDMRDQPSKGTAGAEQQLADALDRVARRLNGVDAGGAKGDAQRLADQLDQVRDARDRLARLEQQVTEAQRAQAAKEGQRGGNGRAAQPSTDGERGGASGDLQRRQQEYAREAQRTRDMVDRLQRGAQASGLGGSTPEQHEWSRSAPGTEAWKQDYAQWDGLRKDVTHALERYEAGVVDKLSRALTADRLRAGGSDRVPDEYQRRIAKYFEALAKKRPN